MSGETKVARRRRGTGPWVVWSSALGVSTVTGGLGYVLLGRPWRTRGIGVNAAANSRVLVPVFLGLTVAVTLW